MRAAGNVGFLHRTMLPRHCARLAPARIPVPLGRRLPRSVAAITWHVADVLPCVDLIAWDNGRFGMGYRSRRCGDYLLILQKPPLRAKATWRDHGIRDRWVEKVDTRIHPHIKPAGLIRRLIAAVTAPGDLIIDPAAGSFLVMHVAHELGRRFIGCDISCGRTTNRTGAKTLGFIVKPRRHAHERALPPRLALLPATRRDLPLRARRCLSYRAARRRQGRCCAHGDRRADPRRAAPARPRHRAQARRHDRMAAGDRVLAAPCASSRRRSRRQPRAPAGAARRRAARQ